MKPSIRTMLLAAAACGVACSVACDRNQTVIFPPEILAKPVLQLNYKEGELLGEDIQFVFDANRPVFRVETEKGSLTKTYDYAFHLLSEQHTTDYLHRTDKERDSDSRPQPGSYTFSYNARDAQMVFGGEIWDVPSKDEQRDWGGQGPYIQDRTVRDSRANPHVQMKDWAITFDGKWENSQGAYTTADNLFGMGEKHTLPLMFFTGAWTLWVQGEPILKQKVINLPVGAEFYYSPVYGFVVFQYKETHTLYVIKVKASGPDVYKDLKTRQVIIK